MSDKTRPLDEVSPTLPRRDRTAPPVAEPERHTPCPYDCKAAPQYLVLLPLVGKPRLACGKHLSVAIRHALDEVTSVSVRLI